MTDAVATIGRAESCDIVLIEQAASREHAKIEPTAEGHVLIDLGAAGGVEVGGEKVARRRLEDGDVITIGSTTLTYVLEPHRQPTKLGPDPQTLMRVGKPTERLGSSSTPTTPSASGPAPPKALPSQRVTEFPTPTPATKRKPKTLLGDPLPPPKTPPRTEVAEPQPQPEPPARTEVAEPQPQPEPPARTEVAEPQPQPEPPAEPKPEPPPAPKPAPPRGGTVPGVPEFPITPAPSTEAVALADTEEAPALRKNIHDEISLDVAPSPQDSWRFSGPAHVPSAPSFIAGPGAAAPAAHSVYELDGVPSRQPAPASAPKPAAPGGEWDWDGAAQAAAPSFYGELADVEEPAPAPRRGRFFFGLFLVALGAALIGGAYYLGFRVSQLGALFGGGE